MSETETTVPPMDSQALYDAAIADAPAQEAPATEAAPTEQAKPEGDGQPRDEQGRFAPKAEATAETEQAPAEQPPPVQPVQPAPAQANQDQDPGPGWIPAWRAREMAQERIRELENKLRQFEKPQEPIDPYVDPEKFRDAGVRQAIDPVEQRMATLTEHYSRKAAIASYGEQTVREAYGWLQKATNNGDPKGGALLQRAMKSIDPFDEIVTAFKHEKAIATVGNDPEKWFEAELERRKADPAFVAKHLGQQNGATPQAANVVKLPPSLNRQPGTSASTVAGDMSDQSLYDYATR